MNLDSYIWYADSLAYCGRISEAFEIYNHINNNICGHIPLARLKNLSKCLIEYVLRLKNDDEFVNNIIYEDDNGNRSDVDHLLCQICSPPNILRCPVTVKCGHTFCKQCCDEISKCPICHTLFENYDQIVQVSITNTSSTTTTATTVTTTTTTYTFPSTSLVTSTVSDSTVSILSSTASSTTTAVVAEPSNIESNMQTSSIEMESNKSFRNSFMPDILVRQLVEKWWSEELYVRNMNDLSMQYLKLNLLDDALKFCNDCLNKYPNNFQSLLIRAEILYKLQNYQSSLADVNHVIKMRQLSPKAFYQKAQSLAALGKFEESLISLCLVICLDYKMEIFTTTNFEKNLSSVVQHLFDNEEISKNNRSYKRRKIANDISTQFDLLKHSRLKKHFRRKDSNSGKSFSDFSVIYNIPDMSSDKGMRFKNILIKTKEEIRKLKDSLTHSTESTKIKLPINPKLIDPADFDCVLCCRTLWKPVVTQCGHTYCWVCLTRCLDYSPFCPLCKSSLLANETNLNFSNEVSLFSKRPATKFLEVAMQLYIPTLYESRFLQEIDLESSIPVFICTTAFPGVPCPLFVYEPRYRLMVRRSIETGDRKFGIVQSQQKDISKHLDIGTLLDIRDCILLGDGCSILSTIGCKRFKIIAKNEKDGYETAKIEYIRDTLISNEMWPKLKTIHNVVLKKSCEWFESLKENLKQEILRTFGKMPSLEENWQNSADGPLWAWWIIAILPLNQQLKVAILATTCLEKRLRAIEKTIDFISGNFKRPSGDCMVLRDMSECNPLGLCQNSSNNGHSLQHRSEELDPNVII